MPTPSAINPLRAIQYQIPLVPSGRASNRRDGATAEAQAAIDAIARDGRAHLREYAGGTGRRDETLEFAMGVAGHLESVVTDPRCGPHNAVQPPVAQFVSAIP